MAPEGMRVFRALVHCTGQPKNIKRLHGIHVTFLLLGCITACGVACSTESCTYIVAIYLSIYGSTALVNLGRFLQFLSLYNR
jgi:hypothetical protein